MLQPNKHGSPRALVSWCSSAAGQNHLVQNNILFCALVCANRLAKVWDVEYSESSVESDESRSDMRELTKNNDELTLPGHIQSKTWKLQVSKRDRAPTQDITYPPPPKHNQTPFTRRQFSVTIPPISSGASTGHFAKSLTMGMSVSNSFDFRKIPSWAMLTLHGFQ